MKPNGRKGVVQNEQKQKKSSGSFSGGRNGSCNGSNPGNGS